MLHLPLPRQARTTTVIAAVAVAVIGGVGGAVSVASAGASGSRLPLGAQAVAPGTTLGAKAVSTPVSPVPWASPSAPSAAAGTAASVAPLRVLVTPDLLVMGTRTVPLAVVQATQGVQAALAVDVGSVGVKGAVAGGIAVDPSRFRAWTPRVTAASDALWRSVAAGDVATSFDLGKQKALPLGGTLSLIRHGGSTVPVRLGALASTQLPGVDLVASAATGRALGFHPGAGALVSAPGADLQALRDRLQAQLGRGYEVALVHGSSVPVGTDPGAFLTSAQLRTVIQAALAQVGKPYVWGATGPDAFDCSGLIGWAFNAIGVQLPRTSQQLWLAGPHVAPRDARAGDLLFWAGNPSAPMDMDHMAMYLGAGMMVVAPRTGDVVKVTRVYGKNFRGAVRLDPAAAARVGGAQWSAVVPASAAHYSATASPQG